MRTRVSDTKRAFAKVLRRNSTDAEQKLWRLLRNRQLSNLKFRRQVPLGGWIVDFVSFKYRLIVEADGSQHFESPRDQVRDDDLHKRGFRLLRFWNNDILLRPESVIEMILTAVEASPSPG